MRGYVQRGKDRQAQSYFHVTPTRNIEAIRREGLIPKQSVMNDEPGVYLFKDRVSLEDALMNWLGDRFDDDEPLSVIEVAADGLRVEPGAGYEVFSREVIPVSAILGIRDIDDLGEGDQHSGSVRDVTETEAFRAWFGDSKVVDEHGKPLVMYHATSHDLTSFAPYTHFGTAKAANDRARDLIGFSRDVVKREPEYEQILPVYLRVENPLRMPDLADLDSNTGKPLLEAHAEWEARGGESNGNDDEPYPRGWEGEEAVATTLLEMGIINIDEFEEVRDNAKAFQLLAAKGYDGIVYTNIVEDRGHDSWIVFDPAQVKSAIANQGTFKTSDQDITKAQRTVRPHVRAGKPVAGYVQRGKGFVRRDALAAFNQWFEGSQVVNKWGRPLVVYHGTRADVTKFEPRPGFNSNMFGAWETTRAGYYFTADPAVASGFAEQGDTTGANVIPAYLSIKNPVDLRWGFGSVTPPTRNGLAYSPGYVVLNTIEDALAREGNTNRFYYENLPADQMWEAFEIENGGRGLVAALKAAGYDGALLAEYDSASGESVDTWVAFDSTQIKSALGNRGTYDPKDPDISKAVATARVKPHVRRGRPVRGYQQRRRSAERLEAFEDMIQRLNAVQDAVRAASKVPVEPDSPAPPVAGWQIQRGAGAPLEPLRITEATPPPRTADGLKSPLEIPLRNDDHTPLAKETFRGWIDPAGHYHMQPASRHAWHIDYLIDQGYVDHAHRENNVSAYRPFVKAGWIRVVDSEHFEASGPEAFARIAAFRQNRWGDLASHPVFEVDYDVWRPPVIAAAEGRYFIHSAVVCQEHGHGDCKQCRPGLKSLGRVITTDANSDAVTQDGPTVVERVTRPSLVIPIGKSVVTVKPHVRDGHAVRRHTRRVKDALRTAATQAELPFTYERLRLTRSAFGLPEDIGKWRLYAKDTDAFGTHAEAAEAYIRAIQSRTGLTIETPDNAHLADVVAAYEGLLPFGTIFAHLGETPTWEHEAVTPRLKLVTGMVEGAENAPVDGEKVLGVTNPLSLKIEIRVRTKPGVPQEPPLPVTGTETERAESVRSVVMHEIGHLVWSAVCGELANLRPITLEAPGEVWDVPKGEIAMTVRSLPMEARPLMDLVNDFIKSSCDAGPSSMYVAAYHPQDGMMDNFGRGVRFPRAFNEQFAEMGSILVAHPSVQHRLHFDAAAQRETITAYQALMGWALDRFSGYAQAWPSVPSGGMPMGTLASPSALSAAAPSSSTNVAKSFGGSTLSLVIGAHLPPAPFACPVCDFEVPLATACAVCGAGLTAKAVHGKEGVFVRGDRTVSVKAPTTEAKAPADTKPTTFSLTPDGMKVLDDALRQVRAAVGRLGTVGARLAPKPEITVACVDATKVAEIEQELSRIEGLCHEGGEKSPHGVIGIACKFRGLPIVIRTERMHAHAAEAAAMDDGTPEMGQYLQETGRHHELADAGIQSRRPQPPLQRKQA